MSSIDTLGFPPPPPLFFGACLALLTWSREEKKVHHHHRKKIFWRTFLAQKKNFPGRWWIQKPYKNQENHIHHRNLSSVDPIFFFCKEKFCTGAGRCTLSFPYMVSLSHSEKRAQFCNCNWFSDSSMFWEWPTNRTSDIIGQTNLDHLTGHSRGHFRGRLRGKSKWGLSKWGLKVLVHNCPRLPTIVVIL